jgi:hypothetical protein
LNAIGLKTDNFEITPGETLSGKDFEKFTSDVIRARFDPMWFMKNIIKWEPYPKQEEIIREFYHDKYSPELQEYKKLIAKCGQRCARNLLIKTHTGLIYLEDLYPKNIEKQKNISIELQNVNVFNGKKFTPATEIIYVGKKRVFELTTEYGFKFECSKEQ